MDGGESGGESECDRIYRHIDKEAGRKSSLDVPAEISSTRGGPVAAVETRYSSLSRAYLGEESLQKILDQRKVEGTLGCRQPPWRASQRGTGQNLQKRSRSADPPKSGKGAAVLEEMTDIVVASTRGSVVRRGKDEESTRVMRSFKRGGTPFWQRNTAQNGQEESGISVPPLGQNESGSWGSIQDSSASHLIILLQKSAEGYCAEKVCGQPTFKLMCATSGFLGRSRAYSQKKPTGEAW